MSLTYRIRKKTGTVNVSLRYRPNQNLDIWITTPYKLLAEEWDQSNQCFDRSLLVKSPRNEKDKNRNEGIKSFNRKIDDFYEEVHAFINENNYNVDSQKLKNLINKKFNLKKSEHSEKNIIPTLMVDFIDYYIKEKSVDIPGVQNAISINTIRAYKNLKNRIKRFNKNLKVEDINDDFRIEYIKWCSTKYSNSTIHNNLKKIKSFVKYAEGKKLNIDKSILNWKSITPLKTYSEAVITLEEQQIIEKLQLEGTLDNIRDWILINCQLGLRISDLMTLKKEMIVNEFIIPITQQKVSKQLNIPLTDRVLEILQKRNGDFPPSISHPKFNIHLKTICSLAGMNEKIEGGKRNSKSKKIEGVFEKWELITSHSLRRSFVTMYRPILNEDHLIQNNTGHTTTEMLNLYDYSPVSLVVATNLKNKMDFINKLRIEKTL